MKCFVHTCLVTLLVIVATTSLATPAATATAAATTHLQQQQHQPHTKQHRQHNHHHRRHRLVEADAGGVSRLQRAPSSHPDQDAELVAGAPEGAARSSPPPPKTTTRLRRISARDYYNKVTQQRRLNPRHSGPAADRGQHGHGHGQGHPEWSYNSYNIHTNLFGPAPSSSPSSSGKGDDNTQDVEFIGSGTNHHEWGAPAPSPPQSPPPRRGYGYVPPLLPTVAPRRTGSGYVPATATAGPPPPLVPARRGYAPPTATSSASATTTTTSPTTTTTTTASPASGGSDASHTTENPFEVGRGHGKDPKDLERRHICMQQRTIQMPVKTTEVYTRPIWKHISTPCQPQTHVNQMCTRVQLVHEQAYRDVIRHKAAQQVTYDCCTGWTRETPHADGCMKPICSTRCQNGGSCLGPDTCSCPAGFTGRFCEHDINECKEEKPCDQTCVNTVGSYYCMCRDGFVLQADQQSCKKIDLHDDDAFEARDLENEIESNEDMAARLQKIERSLANERIQTHELEKSLQATYHVVDSLKTRLSTLEKQQQDLNRLQSNLYATESRTNKLEGMLNLLMKCRNGPNAHCP